MKTSFIGALRLVFSLVFLGIWCSVVPALAEGPFTDDDLSKLAVVITKAAHPTGKNAVLLKHSHPKKDGFLLIKMELEYFGAATKVRYTADALVEIQLPTKADDPMEFTRIDFVDNNNTIPPNRKNLTKLMDEMNARLRNEKAK